MIQNKRHDLSMVSMWFGTFYACVCIIYGKLTWVKQAHHGKDPSLGDPLFQVLGILQHLQIHCFVFAFLFSWAVCFEWWLQRTCLLMCQVLGSCGPSKLVVLEASLDQVLCFGPVQENN